MVSLYKCENTCWVQGTVGFGKLYLFCLLSLLVKCLVGYKSNKRHAHAIAVCWNVCQSSIIFTFIIIVSDVTRYINYLGSRFCTLPLQGHLYVYSLVKAGIYSHQKRTKKSKWGYLACERPITAQLHIHVEYLRKIT